MYKLELKLDGHFVNNFYNGSIYDLVFIDLEFWHHYVNGKAVQRIYGYTITRILKASKQQYIKTKFLEYEQEETQIVKDILKEIQILKHKVFVGFNIQRSDLRTLRNRSKAMNIYSEVNELKVFDLENHRIPGRNKGLSGLFKYLGIKVLQIIDGSYFRYNPNKVLNKKCGYQDILVTMFDYCLRDAAGYFEIVSKWNNKFPLVIKDAITRDSLYYLVNDGKRAAGLSAC
jgi:DNA polymerase elongation subunit (family B)